ncbi:MAG: hypothetical protein IJ446_04280 [Oscillospiraceae bacterium]|nr:hypothetical protein [Oscillospiraceae bacterium]
MSGKLINIMWSTSLMIIGISTLILAGSGIIGIVLPDILRVILGICELVSLPVLAFSTVKKVKDKV